MGKRGEFGVFVINNMRREKFKERYYQNQARSFTVNMTLFHFVEILKGQCTYWKSICLRLVIFNITYIFHRSMELRQNLLELDCTLNSTTYFYKMHCDALKQCGVHLTEYLKLQSGRPWCNLPNFSSPEFAAHFS